MTTMYRTIGYRLEMRALAVTRTSEQSVWYREDDWSPKTPDRREARTSRYAQWHDTWEDAKRWHVARAELRLENAKRALPRSEQDLIKANALTQEDVT